jgi:Uma2 family endonuclease
MNALPARPPRDTGPIELRDFGPTGRRLGTADDCYEGSPWELHRGELWEQMGSKDIHAIVMALLAALFRTHARLGVTVMTDVYCDLSDATEVSVRAPDVVLVGDLSAPRDDIYRGTPILAVEVRGTQSKRYLEEKVKLYLERDWPCTWIVHAERQEVEVLRPGAGSVVYRRGTGVPLVPELDKHGLATLPVAAFFDEPTAILFNDGWVEVRADARAREDERARAAIEALEASGRAVLAVLEARGLAVPEGARARVLASRDAAALGRWLVLAATAGSAEELVARLG